MHPAIDLAERYGAHNYHPLPVVLARGEGAWVWDVDGKRYLDMLSAYSALNQGHRHPRIIAALVEQAERITLTSRAFHNERIGPLLKALSELTGFESSLLMNSGAEAVETAIKVARKHAHVLRGITDPKILVCDGNFHGRTTTIVSFSSEAQYRHGFGPFTPGFEAFPFGAVPEIGPDVAAVMVEPIQGEAGVILPPPGWLKALRAACDAAGCLLITDEIQTGFGRTGRLFCADHDGVRPDGIILGKALGGGVLPVSAFCADRAVMDVITPGDHGSTFGGNPLACAVAEAAIAVVREEKLAERSAELGDWFMQELRRFSAPVVREVRGRGLLIGVELDRPARPFCEKLMLAGLLCKETHATVIRFAPPLVTAREDLAWALPKIEEVLCSA